MKAIKKYPESAELFSKYYEEFIYPELLEVAEQILTIFKECFEKYGEQYDLVISNSVYSKIDLYEFSYRVKSQAGLAEKLVRNNLIFNLKDNFNLGKLSAAKKESLKEHLCNIDDIIGLKIVTSLNFDCNNVRQLIKEKNSYFKDILFELKDNKLAPMRNGGRMHRIKCKYKDQYCFELQIKSKINSAWGDLEHNLFYKDYDFNYIKNNNQDIMKNIGGLLEQVEELMLSIRNSKKEFDDSYQKLNFKYKITKDYKEFVADNFTSEYLLEKNVDKLFYMYTADCNEYTDKSILLKNKIKIPNYSSIEGILSNNFIKLKKITLKYRY